jgi:hypothetical protein
MPSPEPANVSVPETGQAPPNWSAWARFWHLPLRAERLGLMRILLGVALLGDQLFQYLPNLMAFFGPAGVAPAGLHDDYQIRRGRWTILLFNHDDPAVVYGLFAVWVAFTLLWTVGLWSRLTNVATWLLTLAFITRNPNVLNCGDSVLQVGLLLLMLMPSGAALSLGSWRRRRAGRESGPVYVPAWTVRIIQVQLCAIYLSTGLVKLQGSWEWEGPFGFEGTWWDGTSIHYALNYVTMSRWSYASLPLPFWLTATMTYTSVAWEVLFPLLMLHRWTRGPALWFGVLFHLGIYLTIEVGWFSFYTLTLYAVFVPDWFWRRFDRVS